MLSRKDFWWILKTAGLGFVKHRILNLSSSLAFYTIFSLGPMLLVIIFVSDIFWGRQAIEGTIYHQISGFVGDGAALQIQEIIKNSSINGNSFIAFVGLLVMIIAATTVFVEMQSSLNVIWNLKVKTGSPWLKMLKGRLLSFSLVAGLGFLLLVSLIINGLLEGFMDNIQELFPDITMVGVYIANLALTLFVVALLFAIIYKILPDAIIQWRHVVVGSLFTAGLFMIGKFCLTLYIDNSDLGSTYGSAGSLVILLLWIYYSSIILYFGAEFTKVYALKYGGLIKPKEYATTVKVVQIESHKQNVQQNEKKTSKEETIEEVKASPLL
ncbi:MAG: YihY/virulence factor BrkB family protein [Cyclobacteriaceae bacterium]|nr:YihY/virulence factor BrkB family protein [Cyclobacteriaceae bacterium]